METYEVYYSNNGNCPNPKIGDTHFFVKKVTADHPEDVFEQMQADFWSPNNEAEKLIDLLGVGHTSMAVGDVIKTQDGDYLKVAGVGFKELHKSFEKRRFVKGESKNTNKGTS